MITHVAEAGEDRGRVVLKVGPSGRLADVALEAAVRVAQAFHSEIESLFVEDEQLFDLTRFPFAREIRRSGAGGQALSADALAREMAQLKDALSRRVLLAADLANVRARARTIRDEPVRALAKACAEMGPWNVVAFGEPCSAADAQRLPHYFSEIDAATGFVLAGPKSTRTDGPVVAVIEEADRVPGMLRAAERLAAVTGASARLWLVEEGRDRLEWLEGQVRLSLGLKARAVTLDFTDATGMRPQDLAREIGLAGAGFVIARFGGRLVPAEEADPDVLDRLEGPLFLVR